jgi:hypothetical protein
LLSYWVSESLNAMLRIITFTVVILSVMAPKSQVEEQISSTNKVLIPFWELNNLKKR